MKKLLIICLGLSIIGCANLSDVVRAMDDNNSIVSAKYRSTGITFIGADPATMSGARLNIGTMHVELNRIGRDDYEKVKLEINEGSEAGLTDNMSAGITASTSIETTGVDSYVLETETEEETDSESDNP